MKPGLHTAGRVLYAAAFIGFGVVCIAYQDFIKSLQPVPSTLPGHGPLAVLMSIFLLVCGTAIQ